MATTTGHRSNHLRRRARAGAVGAGLVASLLAAGTASTSHAATRGAPSATESAAGSVGTATAGAPSRRVDLETPTFSNPTKITNPLFPISRLAQVIQLGHEGDEGLRHEITLLDDTKFIRWNGQRVETLVSQFVAYGDGRVLEVAVDYFAQADDGSVWYFGEHVDNYVDGVLDNHDGTWLAGRDGPPGMIMPANPRVGDVYRPENIPGVVFEEVTVKAINQTVPGPRGRVRGAIKVQERLLDGVLEDKVFAPAYGEFEASVPVEDELVTVAVAAPTDALNRAMPRALPRLLAASAQLFRNVGSLRWPQLEESVERMQAEWDTYPADAPALLAVQMDEALDTLGSAVADRQRPEVKQATIDVANAALDLELQFKSPEHVDGIRLGVWRRQLRLDRAEHDRAGVAGDRVILESIEERLNDD